MKTIIARFQEMKKAVSETEVDGEVVNANKVEAALRTVGVALRDSAGQFRDLDEVFLELASKWDTLDRNTQRYIATTAAGARQQSRFLAMMDNYARTQELLTIANDSAGVSAEQFAKTLDSLETKITQLKTSFEGLYQNFVNSEVFSNFLDFVTHITDILATLPPSIAASITIAVAIISGKILKSIIKMAKDGTSAFVEKWKKAKQEISKEPVNIQVKEIVEGRKTKKIQERDELDRFKEGSSKKEVIDTEYYEQRAKGLEELTVWQKDATKSQQEAMVIQAAKLAQDKEEIAVQTAQSVAKQQNISLAEAQLAVNTAQVSSLLGLNTQTSANIALKLQQRGLDIAELSMAQTKLVTNEALTLNEAKALGVAKAEIILDRIRNTLGITSVNISIMSLKAQIKEAAQKAKNTAVTWLNTIAQIANNAAHGDLASILVVSAAVVGGVALAATVGLTVATKNETAAIEGNKETVENANKAQSEYAKSKKELIDLTNKYNKLLKFERKGALSEEELQEKTNIQNELAQTYPELISYYNEENNAILKSTDAVKELVEEKKQLNAENREELRIEQERAHEKGYYSEDTEAGQQLSKIKDSASKFKEAEEGSDTYELAKNMAHGYGTTTESVKKYMGQLAEGERGFNASFLSDIIGTKISEKDFQNMAKYIEDSGAKTANEYEAAYKKAIDKYVSGLSEGEKENAYNLAEALGGYSQIGKMLESTLEESKQMQKQLNYDSLLQQLTEAGISEEQAKTLAENMSEFITNNGAFFKEVLHEMTGFDFSGASDEDVNKLLEAIEKAGGIYAISNEELAKIMGETQTTGLTSPQVIREALEKGDAYEKAIEEVSKELSELSPKEIEKVNKAMKKVSQAKVGEISDVSRETKEELKEILGEDSKAYKTMSKQLDKQVKEAYTKKVDVQMELSKRGIDSFSEEFSFTQELDIKQYENFGKQAGLAYEEAYNKAYEEAKKSSNEEEVKNAENTAKIAGQKAAKQFSLAYKGVLEATSFKDKEGNTQFNKEVLKAMGSLAPDENGNYEMTDIVSTIGKIQKESGLSLESSAMQEYLQNLGGASQWAGLTLKDNFTSIQKSAKETSEVLKMSSDEIKGSLDFEDMQDLMKADEELTPLNFRATADGYELVGTSIYEVTAKMNEKTKAEYENTRSVLEYKKAALEERIANAETKEELNKLEQQYKDVTNSVSLYSQAIAGIPDTSLHTTTIQGAADNMQSLIDRTSEMIDVQAEFKEYGELSANTFISLIQSNSDYIDALDVTNGKIVLNEEVMEELRKQEVENFKTENLISINKMEAENELIQNQIKSAKTAMALMQSILDGNLTEAEAEMALDKAKQLSKFAYAEASVTADAQMGEATAQYGNTVFDSSGTVIQSEKDMADNTVSMKDVILATLYNTAQGFKNLGGVAKKFLSGDITTLGEAVNYVMTEGMIGAGEVAARRNAKEVENQVTKTWEEITVDEVDAGFVETYKKQMQNKIDSLTSAYEGNVESIRKLKEINEMADKISLSKGTLGGKGSDSKKTEKELKDYLLELEKLYNILAKIANLEKQLEELELRRKKLNTPQDLALNDAQRLSLIKELKVQNQELLRLQKQERGNIGKQLSQTYGAYVKVKDGYLEVNHAMIATIKDEEFGEALEDLIDQFDEYSDSILETEKALSDYDDKQKEIIDNARDYAITLKDKLLEQVIAVHEKEIETVKKKYEAIKNEDQKYLDSLRKTLDKQRQLRDQDKQQEELDEKEKRLALLSRDTSGVYAKEIKQLQQEIEDQRQTMADTATDNLLTALEEQLNAQHEALDKEVEYLENSHQEKLESMTEYWAEVDAIIAGGYDNILNYLKQHDEEFITGSHQAQEKWLEEWRTNINEALAAMELLEGKFKDVANPNSNATVSGGTSGGTSGGSSGSGGGGGGGYSAPAKSQPSSGESVTAKSGSKIYTQASGGKALKPTYGSGPYTVLGSPQNNRVKVRYHKLSKGVTGWFNISDLVGYSKGGLVNTTGPVMVHGTKNKPEAFLSAADTENIAKFRDVLSSFISKIKLPQVNSSRIEKDGDIYYDIHIKVDGISNDYDVEDMWKKMQEEIMKGAKSRNVISIQRNR